MRPRDLPFTDGSYPVSRQIYPTLLVTSLVLAVVVCFHPSIGEELLSLAGIDLPCGTQQRAQAEEPQYTPIPTVPSARYEVVPRPPVEPTSSVRPASWPAPANVEVSGAPANQAGDAGTYYPPGSYGAQPAEPYPETSAGTVPYGSTPSAPSARPGGTVPPGYSPPNSGAVPQTHAPAEPHWDRNLSTGGNPYRRWEPPASSERTYSAWGRESAEAHPPYQQWDPPNAASYGIPPTAAGGQIPERQTGPSASEPRYGNPGSIPPEASAPGPYADAPAAQPSRYGVPAPPQDLGTGPGTTRYAPSTPPVTEAAASAIASIPRYADNGSNPNALPPPPVSPEDPSVTGVPPAGTGATASPWPQPQSPHGAGDQPPAIASPPAEPFEGAEILARVGSEPVLCSEVIAPVNDLINRNRDQIPEEQIPQVKRMFLKKHLQTVINTKLIYLDAKRKIPEEAMPNVRDQLIDYFYAHQVPEMMKVAKANTREELDAYLQTLGSSLQREQDSAIESLLAQQWLIQQTEVESRVTHEQMLAYYHDHIEEFSFPAKARWQQLTVRVADYPSQRDAYAAIAQMGNLVMDGTPFEQVAQAHSTGPTAKDGGLRDWTTQGSLVSKKLDHALFGLPVGTLSPVLEDDTTFHIVRVLERTEAGREAFVDAQVDIRKKIQEQRIRSAREEYLAKLRKETRVTTVFDNDPTGPEVAQEPAPTTPYRY